MKEKKYQYNRNTIFIWIIISFVIILFLPLCCTAGKPALHVFSGTGMTKPMDEIALAYEQENGIKVNITYKSGGQSMVTMELTKEGDVFFPGSEVFLEDAVKKGLVKKEDIQSVAVRTPVIVVQRGNPKNIKNLEDLYIGNANDVSVCLHDENTTMGKLIRGKFFSKEQLDLLEDNILSIEGTLAQVVTKIELKVIDAGFSWLSYLENKEGVEAVHVPELEKHSVKLSIAPTTYAKNYKAALKFIEYVCGEKGDSIFQKYNFTTIK
ncbi:MAG: extracellular solute-binding protein [Spirochaetales bacterium]|nr:extracellular solute-binding protein [Spirochaetales bacterium]